MARQLPSENTQVLLVKRPTGTPNPDETFEIVRRPLQHPADGQVLVRSIYFSLDPAMRGWMSDARSYIEPVAIGAVMRSSALSEVVESKSDAFKEGDLVIGFTGWQQYAVADSKLLKRISVPKSANLAQAFTLLGITGLTAYFGLIDVAHPKAGETVVVSGAAGATGSLVVQIAKVLGCRVIGIAGGPEKCRFVKEELGADVALDYRSETFHHDFIEATPDYVNVFFDNVGGKVLEEVLGRLAKGARISVCGAISQYNSTDPRGPRNYTSIITQSAKMQGFIVNDFADRFPEGINALLGWLAEGKLKVPTDVQDVGVEGTPHTFLKLFTGANTGKLLVKAGPEPGEQ